MKQCSICKRTKNLYQFDTHRLGIKWTDDGKADECRACFEIERHRVRKDNCARKLAAIKKKKERILEDARKALMPVTRGLDGRCPTCDRRSRCGCSDSDYELDENGTVFYKPLNMKL